MEQHLRNCVPDKSQISGKRLKILLLEIEKKAKKKPNIFSETIREDYLESLLQSEQAEPENDMGNVYEKEMFSYEKTEKELVISRSTGTIPK